jgi:hypothetical protein
MKIDGIEHNKKTGSSINTAQENDELPARSQYRAPGLRLVGLWLWFWF